MWRYISAHFHVVTQPIFIVGTGLELLETLEREYGQFCTTLSFDALPKIFISPNKACQKINNNEIV